MVYTINGEQLTRRKLVTIDGSQVTTQTGIPLMLNIDLPNVATDGKDVRLAKLDGTPIAREIECVDVPNTDSVTIHYPFDTVASTDSQFYVYWGNASLSEPAVDSTYGSEAVWDNYTEAVYLMNNDPSGTLYDSTSNANNGTSSGSMVTDDLVEYEYGKGIRFESSKSQYISIPDAVALRFGTSDYSIYIRFNGVADAGITYLLSKATGDDGWYVRLSDTGNYIYSWQGAPFPTNYCDSRYTTADVRNGADRTILSKRNGAVTTDNYIFLDDTDVTSATHGNAGSLPINIVDTAAMTIASKGAANYFDGTFGFIMISSADRSINYMTTLDNNLNNPTSSGTTPFYKSISTPQHQRRTPQFIN